jgi:hypothetical protein
MAPFPLALGARTTRKEPNRARTAALSQASRTPHASSGGTRTQRARLQQMRLPTSTTHTTGSTIRGCSDTRQPLTQVLRAMRLKRTRRVSQSPSDGQTAETPPECGDTQRIRHDIEERCTINLATKMKLLRHGGRRRISLATLISLLPMLPRSTTRGRRRSFDQGGPSGLLVHVLVASFNTPEQLKCCKRPITGPFSSSLT